MPRPADVQRASVLIADDDGVLRAVMRATLEQSGFLVTEAVDGEDAVARCAAHLPDLLVADVMMPRMNGFTLCRTLRQQPATEHLPILMATALDDLPSIEMAYECGATDFIAKPINWPVLAHRPRYMLRAARAFGELRGHQQNLLAAKEVAEAASRAKSQFLANMSHELRTPLNAIIGFSTMMRDETLGPMPAAYLEYPAMVAESGEHLLGIINSVLEISRAEANRIALDRSPIDVAAVVRFAVDQVREMARRAKVDCTASVAPDLPALEADLTKLRQILVNLLSNAIKFTPVGGSVALTVRSDRDGSVAFVVEDTGIGIEPGDVDLALTPFGQVDTRPSRSHDGIGLGLPLSKRLTELHGGSFEITSTPGEGTVVTVRLPRTRETPSQG